MGTHLRVMSESYPMNTNMAGLRCFSEIFVFWTKVASALEGLALSCTEISSVVWTEDTFEKKLQNYA